MAQILKSGGTILRTGQSIFLTGQAAVPLVKLPASTLQGINGTPVFDWQDAAGNAILVQPTALRQPTIRQNAINSFPVLVFDGQDDMMVFPFFILAKTIFIVYRFLTLDFSFSNNPLFETQGQGPFDFNTGQGSVVRPGNNFESETRNRLFVNGIQEPSRNTPQRTFFRVLCFDCVPDYNLFSLLGANTANQHLEIAHLEIYGKRLTDTDRNTVTGQLKTIYGL